MVDPLCRQLKMNPIARERTGVLPVVALFLVVVAAGLLHAGQLVWVRCLLSDAFDDDAVGATTGNLAPPGQPYIVSSMGTLIGVTTHPAGKVEVVPQMNGDGIDRVVRIHDWEIPAGEGHTELRCHPNVPVGPGIVRIAFALIPGKLYGEELTIKIIDNETTPGTGMVATCRIASTGELFIGPVGTGYVLTPSHEYGFSIEALLGPGSDSWTLKVQDFTGDAGTYQSPSMPTENDVTAVKLVKFETSDQGGGSFDVDDIRIDLFLEVP